MGQIVSAAAKPKRCNKNQLSQVPTPAVGEHILVSSDNSMNAAGQGNFDCYIEGDGQKAATALPLKKIWEANLDAAPTAESRNLLASGVIFSSLFEKENLDEEDVTNTENIRENSWVRYTDGRTFVSSNTSLQLRVRYYECTGIDRIYCKVGSDGPNGASIAFFTQRPVFSAADTPYYLHDNSVQMKAGVHEYFAEVPDNAKWVCIGSVGSVYSTPLIKFYKSSVIDKVNAALNEYSSSLIYQSSNAESSSGITNQYDISSIEDGTQLEFEVTEVSGSTGLNFYLRNSNNINLYYKYPIGVGKYYIEKVAGLKYIRFEKGAAEGNLYNWTLKKITRNYPIMDRTFAAYLPTKQVSAIELGTPFQGYYSATAGVDTETNITSSAYWVSWPLQKTNGFTLRVEFNATLYIVDFSAFDEHFSTRKNTNITTSPFDIQLGNIRGWNIAIRKKDYTNISPTSVADAVTASRVGGVIYEKPLVKYEAEKLISDEVVKQVENNSQISNALTLAEQGYGFNPFVNKPFFYHFRANDFILDGQGNKAIASQSLDDIDFAARLGFSIIEANIHKTSDDHYVVIHGTSGAFGPECKSINTDVITTENLRTTSIGSVTLEWIKTNVRYDSYYERFQTTIPSLEEFCACCKLHNIGIFAGTSYRDAIEICVKYLGQNVIIYNPPSDIRTYYHGWAFIFNNNTSTTPEAILSACREKEPPMMYGVGPALAAQLDSDENLDTLIQNMHNESFLIGWSANYDSEENSRKYLSMGMDFTSSGNDVNPFDSNFEIYDISTGDLPQTGGTISDGVATLASGQAIECGTTEEKIIGKGCLEIRFTGELSIHFGSKGHNGRVFTSDGSTDIIISDYFYMRGTELYVIAQANTTITKFVYKTSKV